MEAQDVKIGMKVKLHSFGFADYLIKICESKNLNPIFVVLERINDTLFDKYRIETQKGEDFFSFEIGCYFFEPYEETIEEYFDSYFKKEAEGISELPTASVSGFFIPMGRKNPLAPKEEIKWREETKKESFDCSKLKASDIDEVGHQKFVFNHDKIEQQIKKTKEMGYKVKSHMFNGSDDFGYSYTLTFNKSMECISKHKGIEMGLDAFDRGDHLPITQEFIESFGFKLIGKGSGNTLHDYHYFKNDISLYVKLNSYTLSKNEHCSIRYTCTTQSELRFLLTKGRIDCSK